jgi:3-dehydroquinate synthase
VARVEVSLPHHQYSILIEPGLLERLGETLRVLAPAKKCAVITDTRVNAEYGARVRQSLEAAEYQVLVADFQGGEAHKSLVSVGALYDRLLDERLERSSPVIALGGGVVGDTAGFVAATYLRGVPFIQCPTSLLAMVDASVGGKVGVNVSQGKNLIGAFYQPEAVLIDTETLRTLPKRELLCGLAECVKHGVLGDAVLFSWIEDHIDEILGLDSETLVELVARNVRLKAEIVVSDEKEQGRRALLNLGHTFGHAIEKTSHYEVQHGEAVSLGIVAATQVARELGRVTAVEQVRIEKLLTRIGLPVNAQLVSGDPLLDAMKLDKKVKDGSIRLVLPTAIGAAEVVDDVDESRIRAALKKISL